MLPDTARDLDLELPQALRDGIGLRLLFEIAGFSQLLLAIDLALVVVVDRQRELARQQVVARVARGDLDDVAAAAEVFDVLSEYHFHRCVL